MLSYESANLLKEPLRQDDCTRAECVIRNIAYYTSILWTAGLEAIPVDQYEAARVDGAGTWQQFWHITWPELQPTLALTLILSLLNAFKVFREAYLVAGRYPQQSIYLLQHLFNNWFLSLDLPRLAAAAVLVALVLLVVILGLLKWWDHCAKDE